jgi:hypothetical protein
MLCVCVLLLLLLLLAEMNPNQEYRREVRWQQLEDSGLVSAMFSSLLAQHVQVDPHPMIDKLLDYFEDADHPWPFPEESQEPTEEYIMNEVYQTLREASMKMKRDGWDTAEKMVDMLESTSFVFFLFVYTVQLT